MSNSTPRQMAEEALKANLANILKKAKEGGKITAAELAVIRGQAMGEEDMPAYADNQVSLADLIGVDRKSIQRWLKDDGNPGRAANGQYSVPDWADYKAERERKRRGLPPTVAAGEPEEEVEEPHKSKLEIRKLVAVCERLEWEQEQRRGAYVERKIVEMQVGEMCVAIRTIMLGIPSKWAKQLEMLEAAQVELKLKDAIDEVLLRLHAGDWPSAPVAETDPDLGGRRPGVIPDEEELF